MRVSDFNSSSMPEIAFRLYCAEVGVFEGEVASLDCQFNWLVMSFQKIKDNAQHATSFSFCLPETYEERVIYFEPKDNMRMFCEVFRYINKLQGMMDGDLVPATAMPTIFKYVGKFIEQHAEIRELVRVEAERMKARYGSPVFDRMLRSSIAVFDFDFRGAVGSGGMD